MSYTKTKIYNLALSHLLLSRQVDETETDKITNEVRVLNTFWKEAFNIAIQELDLDSLSQSITLELLEVLDSNPWTFVYKYPSTCSFLRRLESSTDLDTSRTHISKRTGLRDSKKVIYTNQEDAIAECIPNDESAILATIDHSAALAISYFLAYLSAPLIVGKGAKKLRQEIYNSYLISLDKAQQIDKLENFNYDNPWERSEFVAARME